MKKKLFANSSESLATDINLTPLIDVVFIVLIIFIIIAPMLELDRVRLAAAPERDEKVHVKDNSILTIHIHDDDSILINSKKIISAELNVVLQDYYQTHSHVTPQLFPDKRSSFGTYQVVKNAVELSGFEQLDIILKPE